MRQKLAEKSVSFNLWAQKEVKEMKITHIPELSQQGKPISKRQQKKDRIRVAYAAPVEVQVIPAKADTIPESERPKPRVCAYCRVSTDMDTQVTSYELQVQNYTEYITSNEEWEFAGIYADEGISATSLKHRDDFNRMIADCKEHKIDLIITKAINRFARNILDCLSTIRMLKQLDPPVGVYFETEHMNTLDTTSESHLGLLSLVAQGESEMKSESLKWSYVRRWKHGVGIYPTWSLLGYYADEKGEWQIHSEQAELIRLIFEMYRTGYSSPQIAEILTRNGIPTATYKNRWSSGAVLGILRNEKYCGDVLCQKTIALDIFSHKVIKNTGQKPQYFIEAHHKPIVDKTEWLQVQQMIRSRHYCLHRARRTKPKIVVKGCLSGFTMIDTEWDESDICSIFRGASTEPTDAATDASTNMTIIKIKGEQK